MRYNAPVVMASPARRRPLVEEPLTPAEWLEIDRHVELARARLSIKALEDVVHRRDATVANLLPRAIDVAAAPPLSEAPAPAKSSPPVPA